MYIFVSVILLIVISIMIVDEGKNSKVVIDYVGSFVTSNY